MSKIKLSEVELIDKLVNVGRTAKVVKGGRRFNFSAIVVVGDGNGHVGYGLGKASEVTDAIRKATEAAKRNIYKVTLQNGTLPHEVIGKYGAAKVLFRPATAGTGVIAAGAVRAVLELCGIKDVLTKNLGTSNPHNTVKAAIKGLASLENVSAVAERRGVSIEKVING
ncbi:MAG: 30S ribosomal protein S5 [Bacteroidetes bacterium]|nr:30S ribosomal protein S5 [Bacteroidota bacterium]